ASVNKQQREAAARLKRYEARQQLNATQNKRRVRDNVIAVVSVVAVAALAGFAQFYYFDSGPGAPTPTPTETAVAGENVGAPDADLSEDRIWTGEFTFNETVVGIQLDGTVAPQAVAGFVQDFGTGYYPGTVCHRLASDLSFLQCGSIDGVGGPDPTFSYGPVENAPADDLYPAGSIAMARGSDQYSNGHQFFIVLSDTTLDGSTGGYTIVGTVTSGLDALATLVAGGLDPATIGADGTGFPLQPVTITGFTIQ
ncbi:peptidylprolyl isomerase, partial [Pseudolysinimonas sp.]|uniref:peptidylprolyl isomerase n=1 Tax=Pseudolysinimonas sp. TaxID=2680009 RepID=UPI00286D6683